MSYVQTLKTTIECIEEGDADGARAILTRLLRDTPVAAEPRDYAAEAERRLTRDAVRSLVMKAEATKARRVVATKAAPPRLSARERALCAEKRLDPRLYLAAKRKVQGGR